MNTYPAPFGTAHAMIAQPFVLDFSLQLIEHDTAHLEECEQTDTLRQAISRARDVVRMTFSQGIWDMAWMLSHAPDYTIHPGYISISPKQADPIADPRFVILWEDHFKPALELFAACLTDEAYFGQDIEQWIEIVSREKQDADEARR